MPPGYRIELGGEVEGSSDANERLASNFPIALALMVLGGFRREAQRDQANLI
jgi:Cu/Ag efflux pump CusA